MVEQKKKRMKDAKEWESNVGPTGDISEVNVKKKSNVGPTCVNDAESEKNNKKKKKRNVDDKKKNEKEKKKKRNVGGDVVPITDGGPTSDDVAGGDDDYDEPTCDDVAEADDDNHREMLKKKKRRKSVGDKVMEAIKEVAKAASEAALSAYIASYQKKKKKKPIHAQLQHNSSCRGREEEGKGDDEIQKGVVPSMHLGHKVPMSNAEDITLVTANNQPLPLVPRPKPNWGDAPSGEAEMIMKTALAALNERLSSQGIYEFAGGLHINAFVNKGTYCHINFNVKLVNDGKPRDYNPRAVFAELVRDNSGGFRVTIVERLVPDRHDRAPRLQGCRTCDTLPHRNVLRHGRLKFNPGVGPGFC